MMSGTAKLDRARLALTTSPIQALRALGVQQAGNSIVISGRVECFYHKQLAQETIREICRDMELVNTVSVANYEHQN